MNLPSNMKLLLTHCWVTADQTWDKLGKSVFSFVNYMYYVLKCATQNVNDLIAQCHGEIFKSCFGVKR